MKRIRIGMLALFVVLAGACDATSITGDAPPTCADGPTMGSTC